MLARSGIQVPGGPVNEYGRPSVGLDHPGNPPAVDDAIDVSAGRPTEGAAKRILILSHEYPPFRGGIGRYVQQLARAGAHLGHHIHVLAPDYGRPDTCRDEDGREPFRVDRFSGFTYGPSALFPHLLRCWRSGRTASYDMVHAADWPSISCLAFLNRIVRIPFWATAHGTEALRLKTSRQSRLLFAQRAFEKAEGIFSNSAFTRTLLLDRSPGIDPDKAMVTPLGVADFWFRDAGNNSATLSRLSIPQNKRILLTAARLARHKGHAMVLSGLRLLPDALKNDLVYVVVGIGDDKAYRAELDDLAGQCGVPVIFTGTVSDQELRSIYAAAELFLMPGEPLSNAVEGFGLVYLEAAAQRTPSLATSFAARPEVIHDQETGILVPPRDLSAFVRHLAALLGNPSSISTLGANARRFARRFTWHECARLTYGRPYL